MRPLLWAWSYVQFQEALAMPFAPLPVSPIAIQVHGCHHHYAHDLTGWRRHDNNCRTPG